jgi:hypothetical protein
VGGAASSRAAGCEITEKHGHFGHFPSPSTSRAGRPRPQNTRAFPSVSPPPPAGAHRPRGTAPAGGQVVAFPPALHPSGCG